MSTINNVIEPRLAYNYAIVDRATKMCIEVRTSSIEMHSTETELFVSIPTYNDEYGFKYYDETTGKWYYDDAMTNEWIPE